MEKGVGAGGCLEVREDVRGEVWGRWGISRCGGGEQR